MASRGQSVTVTYLAWDTTNKVGKTGDVANHTLRWVKDGTSSAPSNSPAEVDSTNAPGVYKLVLTTTEATCDVGILCGKSSTSGVVIAPLTLTFEQLPTAAPNANAGLPILSSSGTTLAYTVSTLTTYTGNTPQTGDGYAVVTNGTYGLSALKTLIDAIQTTANALSSKLGAFTGATTNSVYGYLLAMMKADVSAPSTVGGTYDPSTDSLEALRNRGDAAWVTATSVTVSDKTGFKLAADGVDLVVIETALNARQALSIIAAATGGVLAGGGTTTNTIKGAGVATTRITATVDEDGNRSAITLNPPT